MKKYFLLLTAALFTASASFAQLYKNALPVVTLPANVSVHFVSPEPIRYVDISVKGISGDLPVPNILRIRWRDTVKHFSDAVVTITGEKYIAQYHIVSKPLCGNDSLETEIPILPFHTQPIDNPEIGLTQPELKANALHLLAQRTGSPVEKVSALGLTGELYHIYTLNDYIFLDIGFRNETQLPYTIDQLKFNIEDKKVTKASSVQTFPVTPVLILQNIATFDKHYRNIFVFKKLTFPGNKVFSIEMSEQQPSGRTITLKADYKDLLKADNLP